ncbi:MAG: carboxypeptidase-like regulatory domain-containing protein [Bacteroidales bacterium]|nr:carboxypeptidase-like regulatory domain-containing protein [Bacteroidales bacterium]
MKKLLSVMALVSLLSITAFANNENEENKNTKKPLTTTSIKGVILDKDTGESLAGVKVVIAELDQQVYTDLEGNFEFKNVTKNTYTIESEMISYKKQNLKVDTHTTRDLKIVMATK